MFQRNTYDQRVNYQRYNKHGNNQHEDKLPVHGKNLKTARRNSLINQTENTERCTAYDPAHNLGCSVRKILHYFLGTVSGSLEGKSEDDGPEQDSDITCIEHSRQRVIN